jgi:hypothetical protein
MTPNLLRPSTEQKIVGISTGLLTLLVGMALMGGGGWFLWQEMSHPPTHSPHVYLFAGIAILGAFVVRPDPLFKVVKNVFVILGDTNLPIVGGRRKTDPPPPSAP